MSSDNRKYSDKKENKKTEKLSPEECDTVLFDKIFNNIIEINSQKEIFKNKKNKSFSYLSKIPYSKLVKDLLIVRKKKSRDLRPQIKNSFLLLKYNKIKNTKKSNNSINYLGNKNKEISYKSSEKENYSIKITNSKKNLSSSAFKESFRGNFILKSELYKLYKGNNKYNKSIASCQYKAKNQLFDYFYYKNKKDKRRIISNIYIDNEKEVDIKNEEVLDNINNQRNHIINSPFNNERIIEFYQEQYSIKNIYQIDLENIINSFINEEKLLISKKPEKEIFKSKIEEKKKRNLLMKIIILIQISHKQRI